MAKITFKTKDNITISGLFWDGLKSAVLMLHAMPKTKESWQSLAEKLNAAGLTVLAIDERGHGQSTEDGKLDYKNFTEADQQNKILDVEAAHQWLKSQGKELAAIIGGSIGANLALVYQADNRLPVKTVLLSAGLNFRGVKTEPAAKKLVDPQAAFYIGGLKDGRSSGDNCGAMAKNLFELSKITNKKLLMLDTSAHADDLYKENPDLEKAIVEWIMG